ncbi:MAG: YraN family protein [Clostridia bacterium]|nr:YraN family protein [Clostridia bacterium]
MDKKVIGDKGESFAAWLYEKSGYSVVKRNYHSRYGEIDLIAENETELCFVEVKTRNLSSVGNPAEAVDYRKQKKLTLTAMKYLSETECFRQSRFDVLEVWQENGKIVKYNLIENAFYAEDFAGNYEVF